MISYLIERYRLFLIIGIVFITGCTKSDMTYTGGEPVNKGVALLQATEGNAVHGSIRFSKVENGVRVEGHLEGVPPGMHGFHIHQFGDCSSGDGKSAGGHFNPTNTAHGAPSDEIRHVGDLGNISANSDGVAHFDFVDTRISLSGEANILGRGVILHEVADDLTSQPTGAAGSRLACGVIGIAND